MTVNDAIFVFAQLTCWCGRNKFEKHAVCNHCWKKLDADQKKSLYLKIGQGFEQAYVEIHAYLKKWVRPRKACPAKPIRLAKEARS